MGHYFLGTSNEEAMAEAEKYIEEIVEAAEEQENEAGLLPGGITVQQLQSKQEKNLALARVLFEIFIERFPLDRETYRVLGTERALEAKVKGIEQPIQGILDVELENIETGDIWLVDHKTEAVSCRQRASTFAFELQPRLYRLMLSGIYPDRKIAGVIHNVIRKPTIRLGREDRDFTEHAHKLLRGPRKGEIEMRRTYDGEPKYENYLDRCRRWFNAEAEYMDLSSEFEDDPPALQSWVRFNEPLLAEELWQLLSQTDHASSITDFTLDQFPRNGGACRRYRTVCDYIDLCRSNPKLWEQIIEKDFERAPDDEHHV